MRRHERSIPAGLQGSAAGGAGAAPGSGAQIPLQPLEQPRLRQLCPCSPGRAPGSRDPPAALGEPRLEQGMPKGGCHLWETHGESSSHWSSWSLKDFIQWKCDPRCSSLGKTAAHGVDSCWQSECRSGTLWEGPHGAAGEHSSSSAAGETMCDELTVTPFPLPPFPAVVPGRAGKKGEVGRGIFKVLFYFPLSCSDFVGNKFN